MTRQEYLLGVGHVSFNERDVIAVHIRCQQLGKELLEAQHEIRRIRQENRTLESRQRLALKLEHPERNDWGDPFCRYPHVGPERPYLCPTCDGYGLVDRLPGASQT